MRKKMSLLVAMCCVVVFAFSQADYQMWETIYFTPKKESMEELKKGLTDHNKKFHTDEHFKAHVWAVHTGPHGGEWFWAMGPCTFTDLDSRPDSKEHNEDWAKNVDPYIDSYSDQRYWKLNEEYSYMPDDAPAGKVIWAVFDIKPFEDYRFNQILEKVVKVYKEKSYPNSFMVYENQFEDGEGYDVTLEYQFGDWAWLDKDRKFKKDYEEVHGEGSWTYLMEEFKDVVEGTIDEVATFMPELSSDQ